MKTRGNGSRLQMSTSRFYAGFLILCVSIFVATCWYVKICRPRSKFSAALFVFGSSLFDVGNNNYINTTADNLANFWPYGETFFKYPTGRFSDGLVIPDFIAEYAKLPLTLPYLYPGYKRNVDGVNFASGGAGALVETHKGLVIGLETQLNHFKNVKQLLRQNLGDVDTDIFLSKAVYLFNIGANDYAVLELNTTVLSSYSPEEYVGMVIGNLTSVVKEIHRNGGRKFGFLGLADLGSCPAGRLIANGSTFSILAKLHNSALSVVLKKLERRLKGFKYSYTNLYDFISEVINHPSIFDFKEGNVACCGSGPYRGYFSCGGKRAVKEYELCDNPSEYVFFDSVHLTERANQIISQQMWSGDGNLTGPYNLKILFED